MSSRDSHVFFIQPSRSILESNFICTLRSHYCSLDLWCWQIRRTHFRNERRHELSNEGNYYLLIRVTLLIKNHKTKVCINKKVSKLGWIRIIFYSIIMKLCQDNVLSHEYLILTKFRNDWVSVYHNVSFTIASTLRTETK